MVQQLAHAEIKQIWQTARAQLELELSHGTYSTWVLSSPLTNLVVNNDAAHATISCQSAFHAATLKKQFGFHFQRVLGGVLGKPVTIEYTVGTPVVKNDVVANPQPPTISTPLMTAPTPSPSPRVEDLFSRASLQAAAATQAMVRARSLGLRPDYTFETFAVSGSNEMAHAAATAVSNSPGTAYNPLFLYGGVGVGKTHLMHAIGHNILLSNPSAKIMYCTGEEFLNQIVGAIKNKTAINFKERYRSVDILLVDDVQFIAGKSYVQEEFFHTFNALTKRMSQIVLTSDRPPHEISLLEDRLRSRFEAGLMIDIQQPSFELRTAILLIKAKSLHIPLTIDMAKTIAARVDSARKIEGVLNSLLSSIQLKNHELTDELVERVLVAEADTKRPPLNVKILDVLKTVANHYHLKLQEIKGVSRKQALIRARHVAMYLCRTDLNQSHAEVGRWFSNRDHTTVMHAVEKIERLLKLDDQIYEEVSALRMSLSGLRR